MVRRLFIWLFAAALLATGCNSLFGIHEGTPRPICVAGDDALEPMIDDMEDGDGFICELNGRNGHWYTFSDGTITAELMPPGDFDPTLIPRGRESSRYAAHFAGSGFTEWGAGMGLNMHGARQPYDATTVDGIKFWLKSTVPVDVLLRTLETYDASFGGQCEDTSSPLNCNNPFAFSITAPGSDWVEYEVPFVAFGQYAGGTLRWNPRDLVAIQFSVPPGTTFDVWVDDLRFYRCPRDRLPSDLQRPRPLRFVPGIGELSRHLCGDGSGLRPWMQSLQHRVRAGRRAHHELRRRGRRRRDHGRLRVCNRRSPGVGSDHHHERNAARNGRQRAGAFDIPRAAGRLRIPKLRRRERIHGCAVLDQRLHLRVLAGPGNSGQRAPRVQPVVARAYQAWHGCTGQSSLRNPVDGRPDHPGAPDVEDALRRPIGRRTRNTDRQVEAHLARLGDPRGPSSVGGPTSCTADIVIDDVRFY